MKRLTTLLTGLASTQLIAVSAFAWDSTQPNSCSYACKEIPPDSEVLHTISEPTRDTLKTGTLKVLAWNLHKGNDPTFRKDFADLTKDKDLVLLSEVVLDDNMTPALQNVVGFGWGMATSFITKKQGPTGTAIGSAADFFNLHFKRTDDLEPYVKSPKAITLAEYKIPGQSDTLLVASIHGINWSGDDALTRQLQQVEPEFESHKGPILFAGDFNTKNSSRVGIAQKVLAKSGLVRVPWINPDPKKQLDDAFTRGFRVDRAELITSVVGNSSDHPAISLVLTPQ